MTDLRKVHEREVFELVGRRWPSFAEVQAVLLSLGFVFEDDFAWLKRADRVEQWQSESLVDCTFIAQGKEVYPDESVFDALHFGVLIATLPPAQIEIAVRVVFDVADQLRLEVNHRSRVVSRSDVSALLSHWAEDILEETGDLSGSDTARILILMEYEKRRA